MKGSGTECHAGGMAEPRLTEERSKAEIFSALRRSDETQVLLPAPKFVPYGTSEMHFVRESLASEPEIRLRRVRGFISFHIATKEQYFTIHEVNYFTFGIAEYFTEKKVAFLYKEIFIR